MNWRGLWESRAGSTPSDYTNLRIAEAVEQVTGKLGVRGTGAYVGALNFIEDSLAIAEAEGEFSEALRPRLGEIARGLTDCGESVFEIRLNGNGKLALLPATIASVSGGADPADWSYLLTRSGPTESTSIQRPAEAVLAFVAHSQPKTPWRGRGRLEASNYTGALLAGLEQQLSAETRFNPARAISAGVTGKQRSGVTEAVAAGGVVTISGGSLGGRDPAGPLGSGVIRNESTAAVVELHRSLSAQISAVLSVPPDLLGSTATEAGTRESFRRFAASTCSALIEIIEAEWALKIGPLQIGLDTLRAGDIAARARAVGSRSAAFKNLISGGVRVDRALVLAGLGE